jgi:hypothetical protein
MRLGVLRVSYEMLEQMLRFPEGMKILQVFDDPQYHAQLFVRVRGPMCPEVHEGEAIPWIDLTISAHSA